MNCIKIRFLKDKKELDEVGRILYEVYVEELGWDFDDNTPIKIRVDTLSDGRKVLIDDHHYSSQWVGAFSKNKLIGCLRISFRSDSERLLQTQLYQPNNLKLNSILNKEERLIEINRAAVCKKFRGSNSILVKMFYMVFQYAYHNKLSVFFTTAIPSLIKLFMHLYIPKIFDVTFKYEEQDPAPVICFLAKFKKGDVFNMVSSVVTIEKRVH